ncbi:signal peptidase II [Candidatus Berkelbacteria bacterium]|nr:signal peptidase II [Candidatus Berkelbacteria bacterium]
MNFLLALLTIAADQYAKHRALKKHRAIFLNKGIAFAHYQGNNVAIVMYLFGLLVLGYLLNASAPNDFIFALFLGGLFSNALDYVHRGGVVDWLPIRAKKSNLANIAILISIVFWISTIFTKALF